MAIIGSPIILAKFNSQVDVYQEKTVTPMKETQVVLPDSGPVFYVRAIASGTGTDWHGGDGGAWLAEMSYQGTFNLGTIYHVIGTFNLSNGTSVSIDADTNSNLQITSDKINSPYVQRMWFGEYNAFEIYLSEDLDVTTATDINVYESPYSPMAYDALSKVTVSGDANFVAENIKKDISIWGLTGAYEGGGGGAAKKQIQFIDYDGTVVESYTAAEFSELTALPNNPSHTGLVAQGWNWTLAQIQNYLADYPDGDVNVGQMYITKSGNTEIDIELKEDALNPYLVIAPNGTVVVDWGDGSSTDTLIGTSLTTRKTVGHIYPSAGNYTISLYVQTGSFTFYQNNSQHTSVLNLSSTMSNRSRVYADDIIAVRFGNGVTSVGNNAFNDCHSLTSLTIPSGVTSIEYSVFNNCYSLTSLTIPSSVTSIGNNAFSSCYSLISLTIPSDVTSVGNNAFYSCYSVTEYHFQSTTPPALGTNNFTSINPLCKIYVPAGSLSAYQTATRWSTYASYMEEEP